MTTHTHIQTHEKTQNKNKMSTHQSKITKIKKVRRKMQPIKKYQSSQVRYLATSQDQLSAFHRFISHGRVTGSQGATTRQRTTTVNTGEHYRVGRFGPHATNPFTTKQPTPHMRTQPSIRQPLNRSGFLCLACGFDDFAQSRPELRLAANLGWARVLPCFVLIYSVIFV